jgi:hypothetical protein
LRPLQDQAGVENAVRDFESRDGVVTELELLVRKASWLFDVSRKVRGLSPSQDRVRDVILYEIP